MAGLFDNIDFLHELVIDGQEQNPDNDSNNDYTQDDNNAGNDNNTQQQQNDQDNDNDTEDYTQTGDDDTNDGNREQPPATGNDDTNTGDNNTANNDNNPPDGQDQADNQDDTTDYTQDGNTDQESDTDGGNNDTGGNTQDTGENPEQGGQDSGGESTGEKSPDEIKQLEDELFNTFSQEQLAIMNKELKNRYLELYTTTDALVERVNDIPKVQETISVIGFITDKLSDLRDLLVDYINKTYDTITYTENGINYNKFLATLHGINDIIKELAEKMNKEDDKK